MEAWLQLLPFVLILLLFWLLLIRPARKRQVTLARMQSSVQTGDQVILSSGLYGAVEVSEDDIVHLEIAPTVTVRVARGAVVRNVSAEERNRAPAEPVAEHEDTPSDPKTL